MPYKFINCCSGEAHLRQWHIYVCITNSLLFRYSSEKKIKLSPFFPVILKRPYGRPSGKLGPYLAMANVIKKKNDNLMLISKENN